MKNIFYILLLLPTIIFAQYPSNSGHKITLGEQTTADGLIYRGVAATDTLVRKPSIDTMAYMVLDTTTNIMWHYKKATSNAWLRVGGSISSGLTGVLPVANGGTNASTFTEGSVVFAGASGTYTQDNSNFFWDNTNKRLGIGTNTGTNTLTIKQASASMRIESTTGINFADFRIANTGGTLYYGISRSTGGIFGLEGAYEGLVFYGNTNQNNLMIATGGHLRFLTSNDNGSSYPERMRISSGGNVGIGTTTPGSRLVVKGITNTNGESALNVTNSSEASLLFVRNDGNVGIGTDNPTFKLDVNGTGRFSDNLIVNKEDGIIGIDANNNPRIGFVKKSGFQPFLAFSTDPFLLRVSSGSEVFASNTFTTVLSIATTGAATFSSSVAANSLSLTTPLAVANGGTGSATQNFVDLTTTQSSIGGAKTFTTGIKIINNINTDATNLFLSNNNAGTSTEATLYVSNNNSTNGSIFFETLGENFTTLGGFLQDAGVIGTGTEISNGMSLMVRAAADMRFYTSGHTNERMRIKSDGEVNIGYGATDNGAYKLQVNSQIFATNATIATSDIRFKENIQPLDKGLEIINKLKPVKFNFITTTENNFSEFDEIGFIAQDVEGALSTELFAKAVVKKLDEDKEDSALGLMTEKFIPILVKAIQEQQALIKALEQRIINLENK